MRPLVYLIGRMRIAGRDGWGGHRQIGFSSHAVREPIRSIDMVIIFTLAIIRDAEAQNIIFASRDVIARRARIAGRR